MELPFSEASQVVPAFVVKQAMQKVQKKDQPRKTCQAFVVLELSVVGLKAMCGSPFVAEFLSPSLSFKAVS